LLLSLTAATDAPALSDCQLAEADYHALKRELKELGRSQRHFRPGGDLRQDGIVQLVAGRKWIGAHWALQIGGGVMALIAMGEGIQQERLAPSVEARIGVAPRR